MAELMDNRDYRNLLGRMAALLAAFAAVLVALFFLELGVARGRVAEQSAALVGRVVASHPELEQEVVAALTGAPSAQETALGWTTLARYGYTARTPLSVHPVLAGMVPGGVAAALAFMAALASAVLALLAHGFRGVYRRVREIAAAAERVVDGNFSVRLPSGAEGEFEILGHRFNQMANRLKLGLEQLRQEKVFLKNIISDISHQLKTPLSTLIVYNDILSGDRAVDQAQRQAFLGMERQQLQRLEWLIQNLLKMARLEAGSIAFRREKVTLLETARAAAAALGAMAAEAGVAFRLPSGGDVEIMGDGEWLSEALINIMKNGVEHSRPGGAVSVALEQSPLFAAITISDRGEGIGAADLPHIFERFYRGSHSVKPNSIGIGLALAKAIVEEQGGSISVRSELGRGSEFTVTFLKDAGGEMGTV